MESALAWRAAGACILTSYISKCFCYAYSHKMQLHAIQLYGSSGSEPTSLSDLILLIVGNGAADTNRLAGAASLPHRPTKAGTAKLEARNVLVGNSSNDAGAASPSRARSMKAPADGNITAELEARSVLVGNCSIIIFF